LEQTGRVEQRSRLLPSRLVVYFVLAMCLFAGQGYEEVARLLTDGLQGVRRWRRPWSVPTTAAIWKARKRVGVEPMRELFDRVCRPVAEADTLGAFFGRWRVVALDATTFDVPDTVANEEAFGRPGSGRGEERVGYAQVRMVGLVECGTHAVFAAATGPLRVGETTLARARPQRSCTRFAPAGRPWVPQLRPVAGSVGDRRRPALARPPEHHFPNRTAPS
jgi:hypothetical protein